MKIASWNLNHRSVEKDIPHGILDVIGELAPDVLVLTEYVDADSREDFKDALTKQGFSKISVSTRSKGHNQILIASRQGHSLGSVLAPVPDSHAETNYLSVHIAGADLEVIGLRAPAYTKKSEVDTYWLALAQSLEGATDRRVLIIGDVNGNPADPKSPGGKHMSKLQARGWNIPVPVGDWSYTSGAGNTGSCIDHVIASAPVGEIYASYLPQVGRHVIAGAKALSPLSDHAILLAELKLANRRVAEPPTKARSEIILRVAAEGGELTLVGIRKGDSWTFHRDVRDWTPELLDEDWDAHASSTVDSWDHALDLLDRYPWHILTPIFVHSEFRKAIFDAIEVRYDAGADPMNEKFAPAQRSSGIFEKWRRKCAETMA